jgi:hypothetical protein
VGVVKTVKMWVCDACKGVYHVAVGDRCPGCKGIGRERAVDFDAAGVAHVKAD